MPMPGRREVLSLQQRAGVVDSEPVNRNLDASSNFSVTTHREVPSAALAFATGPRRCRTKTCTRPQWCDARREIVLLGVSTCRVKQPPHGWVRAPNLRQVSLVFL
jgi:hypothetical protein